VAQLVTTRVQAPAPAGSTSVPASLIGVEQLPEWEQQRTLADRPPDDAYAPIPAIRGDAIERPESRWPPEEDEPRPRSTIEPPENFLNTIAPSGHRRWDSGLADVKGQDCGSQAPCQYSHRPSLATL
jgi:hypothetical protein